jgi:hypothetical protein
MPMACRPAFANSPALTQPLAWSAMELTVRPGAVMATHRASNCIWLVSRNHVSNRREGAPPATNLCRHILTHDQGAPARMHPHGSPAAENLFLLFLIEAAFHWFIGKMRS